MILRFTKWALFLFVVTLILYFIVLGIWANTCVSELIRIYPSNKSIVVLPINYENTILRIEDPTFYQHFGIDISIGQGMTTLTSAIAKDIFLFGGKLKGWQGFMQSFYRGFFQCCKKIDFGRDLMAVILNKNMSKREQLDFFISNVYLGSHKSKQIRGLEQASMVYFLKPVNQISKEELITFIAMMKAPNTYHPVKNPDMLKTRHTRILSILEKKCVPSGWFDTLYEDCEN